MSLLKTHAKYLAWLVVLASTLGSLYFSEVLGYAPCILCWYQRIAIYPLALIIPIGIARRDVNMPVYTLALAGVGWLIALYHNLLQYNIISEKLAPCTAGIPCVTNDYLFGTNFITIPLLSLIALSTIIVLMVIARRSENE